MATTIFTDYGQQLITEAIANKTTINITKIAVGDGMGAVYTPISSQTALKRETWSGPIDSVQVNPTNKNQVTFEGIVGANVGGFYIREIGLYDQTNKLVAISDFPESFKALADQYELYVRMILQTGSADVTNIIINKDMIYATKKYVDTEVSKKYTKPTTGIPKTDLESSVQSSLVKADSALQSVTKADVGLGNVDNTSDANKPVSTAQQTALNLKANIASPTFTGTPKAPTAVAGTNTTQLATTAFVKTAIDNSATTINDNIASVTQDITTHKADLAHVHWIGTAIGTNTLTATYEAITALKNGLGVAFLNTTSSTLATTLNINGLGAIPILKANGNPVTNLKANGIYTLRYANGNFILQGEGGEYGNATASDVLAGKTFGTENGVMTGILSPSTLGAVKYATGTVNEKSNTGEIAIKNLSFQPKFYFANVEVLTLDVGFSSSVSICFIASATDVLMLDKDKTTGYNSIVTTYSNSSSNKVDMSKDANLFLPNGFVLKHNTINSNSTLKIKWQAWG